MKQVIKLSLLCSALWLAGCGDETNSSGASTEVVYESYIQQALQRDTTIKFSLSGKDANVPLPSFCLNECQGWHVRNSVRQQYFWL